MANFQPAALIEYDGRLLNGTDLLYDTSHGVRIWGNATQDNYSIGDTTTGGVDSTYGNNNIAIGAYALNTIQATGTTKNNNIAIGTNSLKTLGINSGVGLNVGQNISIGLDSAKLLKTAYRNIFIGYKVFSNFNTSATVGTQTLIGNQVLSAVVNSIGDSNTIVGSLNCPVAISCGQQNTMIGSYIGQFSTGVGSNSVFIGSYVSATSSYTPDSSVYIGTASGPTATVNTGLQNNVYIGSNSSGSQDSSNSVSVGYYSLANNRSITIGSISGTSSTGVDDTIVIGYNSGRGLGTPTGSFNITIGSSSANNLTSAANNILIGNSVATNLTSGSNNIIIGASLSAQTATGSNNIDILTNSGTTGIQYTNSTATLKLLSDLVNIPAGRFSITGVTSDDNTPIAVTSTVTTTTTANIYPLYYVPSINPTAANLTGNVIGINVNPKYISNFIPNGTFSHYSGMQIVTGATSALTTAIPDVRGMTISFTSGLYAATVAPVEYTHLRLTDPTLNGSTNTYNIYSGSNTATGKWNLYLTGTSLSYMASALLIASTTDSGTGEKLQVTGSGLFTTNLKVSGTQINTAAQANTSWLGTGTANSTTFLRGDGTWATPGSTTTTTSMARTFALMGA